MNRKLPRVIAHRGFSGIAPENTLAAFRAAIQLGVEGIEFDVRFSKDLEVMVIHDSEVNRTTNGRGAVGDLRSSEIQRLDAGSWLDPKFRSEFVPTLKQIVSLTAALELEIVLEIKPCDRMPGDFVERILRHFPSEELKRRLLVLCFDHRLLSRHLGWPRSVRLGALVDRRGDPVGRALAAKVEVLALRRNLVRRRLIMEAHEAGLELIAWTVDHPRQIAQLCHWGIDAVITNHPDRALEVLAPGF